MLDKDGYRPNVGIILLNSRNEVFWGKRVRQHSWQFPQGGIKYGESPEQAMLRELWEEVGLKAEHVKIVGRTREWLRYDVPEQWIRRELRGNYRGQKQIWFLLRLTGRDCDVCLRATAHPEFDAWRWHDYWVPLETVIEFKRDVYQQALLELSRFVFKPGRSHHKVTATTRLAGGRRSSGERMPWWLRPSLPAKRPDRYVTTRLSRWISSGSSMNPSTDSISPVGLRAICLVWVLE